MRKRWAGVLPLVMVAGSLVAVPQVASPAQAAPAPATTLQPSSPITMERFNYWSGVSTQFVRPVVLQKKVGSSWGTIFSGSTAANGRYRFTVHTGSVDTLRSYAAPVTHKGKTYPGLATAPVTVRPVSQSIGLSMASTSAATVTTSPGRNGRLVTVQRYSGGKWVHVSHAKTNATGKYSFKLNAPAGSFRAVASGFNGAASMVSASKSVKKQLTQPTIITLPGGELGYRVTTQRDLESRGVPSDLAAYLMRRLAARSECSGNEVLIRLKKVRVDDFASGNTGCIVDGEPEGGVANLWYKKAGAWHEYGTNNVFFCADLRAKGVPIPPAEFITDGAGGTGCK